MHFFQANQFLNKFYKFTKLSSSKKLKIQINIHIRTYNIIRATVYKQLFIMHQKPHKTFKTIHHNYSITKSKFA